MTTFIDLENVEEVKDFMLRTLIKKENMLNQIEMLQEEIKAEKRSNNRWLNLYLETCKENTSLKKELEQIKSNGTQAQEGEEGHKENIEEVIQDRRSQ